MATLGLDDSAYRKGVQNVQSDTKKTVTALSSEYSKAANSVATLTKKYNEAVAHTGKASTETKNLKNMLSQAQAQMKATASALKNANNGMQDFGDSTRSAGESITSALAKGQMLGNLLSSLASKAVSAAKSFVQTGIDYNVQIEKYTTGFTNMLGSAEAAQQAMAKIQEDAARTPFDVESLTQANQLLIGAGENAAYAEKVIMALGNAVSATGGTSVELSRMAQNLQQVANVGKAASIDIKQFAYAGINIYQVLADYTGKSVQEVQNMTISYDVLSQALIAASEEGGRYYNAMDTQSQTLKGRTDTLKDNFKQLAGAMTTDVANAFGQLVTKANELVVAMKDGWDTDGFQGMMDAAAQTVPQLEGVANALKWVADNSNTLIPVLETLVVAFVSIKTAMGVKGALGAITALLNPANLLIAALGLLAGAVVTAYTEFEPFRTAVNGAFNAVKNVAGDAVDWVTDKINNLISGVAGAIAALNALKNGEGWEAAKSAYTNAYNSNQQSQKSKKWSSDHSNMEWDENNGWVPKSTANSSSGNGTSRPENFKIGAVSSISGGSGSTGKKSTGSKTETVIASTSHTTTTSSMNELGAVTKSVETLNEKVKDAAGNVKDRVTETTTETGKEMVNGIATTYKLVTKTVDGVTTKVTKVYDDMSKSLTGTLTTVSEKTFNGITTTTQKAVETYADGSEHIKETVTETGERIVEGAKQTYTKVITYVDGVKDKVTETAKAIDKSVKATQKRINESLSKAKEQLNSGFFGLAKNIFTDLKDQDWEGLGLDIVNLIWGQVSQDQREVLADWASKALEAINDAYSGGGLQEAFNAIKQVFTSGIKAGTDGATTNVKGLGEVVKGLGADFSEAGNTIVSVLGTIGTTIGTFVTDAGAGLAGLASNMGNLGMLAEGAGGLISQIGGLIMSNPEVAAVIAIVAGVVALGAGIWAAFGKKKSTAPAASPAKQNYTDIQDAYWYGNERAFAGYDYRTDPYTFNPNNSAVLAYQNKVQEQLARLTDVVQQYLPDVANQQIVLDDGTLVGRMAPGMNEQLGRLQALSERGN